MVKRLSASMLAILAFASLCGGAVQAQPYYDGKTLRIVVGLAAGGGFDTYARVIGRHLGKHIPGNPTGCDLPTYFGWSCYRASGSKHFSSLECGAWACTY